MSPNDVPKGPDDAVLAGLDVREASAAESVEMLAEAAALDSPNLEELLAPLAALTEDYTPSALQSVLTAVPLSALGLDLLQQTLIEGEVSKHLRRIKVPRPADVAAAAFKEARASKEGQEEDETTTGRFLKATEPHPHPVEGAGLLTELVDLFERYLTLGSGCAEALSLWAVATYCLKAMEIAPRLAITSPEKRCGKTTTLTLLGALVEKPLQASSISAAALYRAVDAFSPTIMVDEADTFLNEYEELRGIINSGFGPKAQAKAVRCSGDDHDVKVFRTFGFMAIACIKKPPATIYDRSIDIPMQRQKSTRAQRLRLDRLGLETESLRQKMARWAEDNTDALKEVDPQVPAQLHDRAADCWRPLLAIADLAGDDWPTRAREAASAICATTDSSESEIGAMLLSDIRSIFEARHSDHIKTEYLLEGLWELKERPWPEWKKGRPISARSLAGILKQFGIISKNKRTEFDSGKVAKHYFRADFEDAFDRYISPTPPLGGKLSATTLQPSNDGASSPFSFRYNGGSVADENRSQTAPLSHCSVVAHKIPPGGVGKKKKRKCPISGS